MRTEREIIEQAQTAILEEIKSRLMSGPYLSVSKTTISHKINELIAEVSEPSQTENEKRRAMGAIIKEAQFDCNATNCAECKYNCGTNCLLNDNVDKIVIALINAGYVKGVK